MRKITRLFLFLATFAIITIATGLIPAKSDAYNVYFQSNRSGAEMIYRVAGDSAVPVSIEGCEHPSVTADNRMLVYTRIEETLWGRFWNVFYVINGNERKLSTNEIYDEMEPVISRDGSWAAYTTLRAGNLEIITLPLDRNELQYRITQNEKPDEEPTLPDSGEWVYWTGRTGNYSYIFRAPGSGGHPQRISAGATVWEEHPSICAAGRYLVYATIIEEEPVEETSAEVAEEIKADSDHKYPGMGGGGGSSEMESEEIQTFGEDEMENIENDEGDINRPEGNMDIWILDQTTGERTRLTDDPGRDFNPCISADGSRIVFTSDRDGNYEIYMINRDGTGLRRLTTNDAVDDFGSIT